MKYLAFKKRGKRPQDADLVVLADRIGVKVVDGK